MNDAERRRLQRYEYVNGQRAVVLMLACGLVSIACILHLGIPLLAYLLKASADSLRVFTRGGVVLAVILLGGYLIFLWRYPLYDSQEKTQDQVPPNV